MLMTVYYNHLLYINDISTITSLVYKCPLLNSYEKECRHENCPISNIMKNSFNETIKYVKTLSQEERYKIIEKHIICSQKNS